LWGDVLAPGEYQGALLVLARQQGDTEEDADQQGQEPYGDGQVGRDLQEPERSV
jgi:hypothetical protein